MAKIKWDQPGERRYERGVDHGVLYRPDANGVYNQSAAWNGLTQVTESPSGAEPQVTYADNIKYITLQSPEDLSVTVEAVTFPKLFNACNGLVEAVAGVLVSQQSRAAFGMKYRSKIGTDLNPDAGYKIHLLYNALAAPSEQAYATENDSPEPLPFSWDVSTSGVEVPGYKSSSLLTVDSTMVDAARLATLLDVLHGTAGVDPRLPLPAEVFSIMNSGGAAPTVVRLTSTSANGPQYNSSSHVITLPNTTGVQWYVDGVATDPGALPALSSGQSKTITAAAKSGYVVQGQDRWTFDY